MLEQNKNPISPLVAGQLPDFVKIDHPTLNSFLSAYYEWLDKDTTYLRSPKRLNEVIDIDTTMDEFVAKFKNEFLFDFPETLAELDDGTTVDASKLVKNIKSFYKAKGTEKTYDFLFRILYDTGVEFYYPKKDILKLSHGKWILKKTIKLSNFLGSTIFDSIGETVKQRNSQGEITASGRVMDATTYRVGIYEIAELSLGGINGTFDVAKGEVEFVDNYGNVRKENRIFPVIGEVTITTAGSGYLLGDRVVLTPAAGDTGLNALGRVSEISSTGGVKKVMMYNLGVNYKVSPTISIISELGKDFSGTVSVSAQANYAGYYANSDGKLGSNKVIQDNHYYQDFSYVMLAEITIDRYRDVIKKLLNPAGMAFFGKILLKRCAAAELNQSTALAQYEVPLIGNYLPYTFITYEDLSKWFVKTITVNGKVQTTIDGYNRNMQESVIRNDYTRDGIVDGQDYNQWLSMHPQDTSTEKQFIQKIGNPFASQNVNPGTDGNPLLRQGSTEHPFWIVYQHPNRKVADTVVARIPYDLKNDFLSNHGALALTGSENFPWNYPMPVWNPSATGVSGVLGFAASAEEPEAVPTGMVVGWGRNPSSGFSGNNQCFGTNSDGTEIYEKAGTEWNPVYAPLRRSGTTGTGMYGDTVKILGSRLENVTKVMTVGSYWHTLLSGGVTIALKDSGLIAWGNSDISIMSIPVSARSGVSDFHAHSNTNYGSWYINAIKTDGRVFSWGSNFYGQCGGIDAAGKTITSLTGSTGQYLKWGASDLTGAIQIENCKGANEGRFRNFVLLNTGRVVTWSGNHESVLGTSSAGSNIYFNTSLGNTGTLSNVSVMGNTLTGAIQIATGAEHAIALKSNGTVVALDTYSVVPTGLTGVVSIVAVNFNSAAVLSDGTIRIWGATNEIWPTGTDYTGNAIAGPTPASVGSTVLGWTGNSPYKIWGETLTGISALFAPKTAANESAYAYLYAKKQDGRLIPIHGNIYPSSGNGGYDKFGNYSRSAAAAGGASGNTAGNLFDWYQSGGDLFPFDGRFTKASSCNGGLTSISCCGTVCVGIKDGLDSFPDITSITGATSGPFAGGTQFTVNGTEFHSDSIVKIDGVTAASATINSPTSITVTTPAAKTSGTKVVSVENACGFAGMTAAFTYLSDIVLTYVAPASGYIDGGTSVLLSGTNLSGITSVIFGGVSATGLTGNHDWYITVTAPAHSAGIVDVSVISPAGTSTLTGGFEYLNKPPTITTISPNFGPTPGGTTITITGTSLASTLGVSVDGNPATGIVKINDTQITAVTPAGTVGSKSVVVTTSGGSARPTTGGFTYTSVVPTIAGLSPSSGPTTGGTAISIVGTLFVAGATVTVGGATATSVVVVGQSNITAVTPTGAVGARDVVVTTSGGSATRTGGFTYTSVVPTITTVNPNTGPTTGGTEIIIKGTNFFTGTTVTVGERINGNAATSVVVDSSTQITAVTPPGIAGLCYVIVTTPNGTVEKANGFTYLAVPLPTITNISPISGPTYGGTAIAITGTLLSGSNVYFDGLTGNVYANTASIINVTSPAHSAGLVDVVVVAGGLTATSYNGYTYVSVAPTVSTINPNFGPSIGGTPITVIGTNLTGTTSVTVGGATATSLIVGSSTQITAVTPAGSVGPSNVIVTTANGTVTKTGGFTYIASSPTISAVNPNFGPTTGGTPITVIGTNLTGTTSVTVGGATATSLIVGSSTQITAVTPAGAVGAKSVVVTTPEGSVTGSFTYVSTLPTISSYGDAIIPNSGPTVGGTAITITGTNFLTGATVTVDGNYATSVVVVSSTQITAVTPAGTLGAKHVTVTTSGGTATAHNAFTYIDPAPVIDSSGNGVIPNRGPTTGGTPITILGNYFNGANKVTVGGKPATNVVVVSKTIITAVTPAGSQGVKDISVTTASGTGTLRNAFTYYLAIYSGPIHIEGAWPEWNESVTANREYWTREFTEGDRYVSLSYNPLVPIYQDIPGSDGATGLSVYKNTTSTVYGNPTNLYDSFVVDGTDWSKEQLEALGPSFVGGKRCYKFTETELNLPTNRTTESIVNSLETWLYSQGFNRTTQQYVILKLNQENTLEMIQVLRGIKRLFPEAKFGYYDYPKIPSFVLVIEQQYNSFEYLSDASRNTIIENTTNSIYDLIKEQDLIVLDMHFSSPSLAKMKVLAAAKIKVADRLNEKLVAEGLRRKVVIVATSRIWKTNSTETPIWVRSNEPEIAQSTRDQYYIPEYSVVKPSTFINTFKDIIGTVAGESRFTGNGYRTIDGYYNDLDPQFLLQAALGSTHADYVNSIYNDIPPVLNTNRSINTDSYQTLIRKSLSTYVNYSKGVTGSTEFYSATGATASNWHYNYWFPLVNKKISSIPSAYYSDIKTDILYNAIYPIYYKFNYLISMAYSAAGQAIGGFNLSGNLLDSWPTSDTDSPEVTTLLGDLDGSGIIDYVDLAAISLNWGEGQTANPEYRYDAPWTKTDGEVILPANKLLGYKIAYSDFRKITARSFFEMPVGREFNCTTDEVTAPPVPVVFAAKINGSAYPLQTNYDHTDASNLVTGGENLVLNLEAERGITGTPTEGISSLVYLGYYGIRSLWAELYAVKPSEAGYGEIEYQIANAGPFRPTSSIISINTPFPNFENPNTINQMFTANYRISDSSSFLFGGLNIVKNNFFMRLKLVFRNGSNSAVPNATKVMDFNYNRT